MKLVYKTILINTIVSISILCIGEWSLYAFLKHKLNQEAIEHLFEEHKMMLKKLNNGISIDLLKNNIGDEITVLEIASINYITPVIKDTTITEAYGSEEEEEEEKVFLSKKIIFDAQQQTKNYRISILKTTDQDEDFEKSIQVILTLSGLIMVLVLISINVVVYNKLFSPVFKLIKDMGEFSIQKLRKINAPKTSTLEFQKLGKIISNMSKKNIEDYMLMKEFTENMAHEIQTPIAVISSKIEQCMQDRHLTETQSQLLGDANKALNKLFHLNKGLSLLSKLDNKQYTSNQPIKINYLIKERLSYFSDFIEDKHIEISENYTSDITVDMDTSLAETLFDNIFKNAIKHNFEDGKISIITKPNSIIISNTGDEPTVPTEQFFTRFYSKNTNESLGLGLSIIKKIIDYYHFKITYVYANGFHQITIQF
jgi:signal transduction histidine kinase